MTQSSALTTLAAASSPSDLLLSLKNLKNSVIGNTWRKVEVSDDDQLLSFLLNLLEPPELDPVRQDIVIETTVILGALATVGPITLRSLLNAGTSSKLLSLIKSLQSSNLPESQIVRILPSILRALRNVLVTTADLVWGHMWGVGAEKKVVGTGLVGEDVVAGARGKNSGKGRSWRVDATRALSLCFEQGNLNTLMLLIQQYPDNQVLLPLYQLFSRLIALPSHREALLRWRPPSAYSSNSSAGPSILRLNVAATAPTNTPYILDHLLTTISLSHASPSRRANTKLLEASLDLLAALVKGQSALSTNIRLWTSDLGDVLREDEVDQNDFPLPRFISILVDMLLQSPTPVRIASANCLTNILKGDKAPRTFQKVRTSVMNLQLLDVTAKLLKTEGLEDEVKLCFILAALVSDDSHLQKNAADQGVPAHLVQVLLDVDRDEENGKIGSDLASRSKEAILLALAALSFSNEPTRALLADTSPPFLPFLLKALSHPSYGVRAAACQVARALSRTIAILRTNLIDSGVGMEVIETLKREVGFRRRRTDESHNGKTVMEMKDDLGERAYTVEVAATATICNLIADFSPLRTKLIDDGGLELLCQLTRSPYEPLALNALWAIKNLVFRGEEQLKTNVMNMFGWDSLRSFISPSTPVTLRIQALEITQNLLADALASEVSRCLDLLGEGEFLDILTDSAREGQDPELRIPALYVLSNLALGNEKTRSTMVSRVETLEVLSEGINAKADQVKIPAIRTLRHLMESNAKTHRPRQAIADLFQPYQLKPRLKELAESSPSLDVCQGAVGLLEVLDRGRDSGAAGVGSAPR